MSQETALEHKYDVCLSFAGEDREYVDGVASSLRDLGISVFYDNYEQVSLWGKDLYVHLDNIYRFQARYCVLFISEHYAKKVWTNHERASAQARAFESNVEYILPARFDDTSIPGIRPTVGYLSLKDLTARDLAGKISEKVGKKHKGAYFPSDIDILLDNMEIEKSDEELIEYVEECCIHIFRQYMKLNGDERRLLLSMVLNACHHRVDEHFHVYLELVLRDTEFTAAKVKKLLGKMKLFGFDGKIEQSVHEGDDEKMIITQYNTLVAELDDVETDLFFEMFWTGIYAGNDEDSQSYCSGCALKAVLGGDFSQLSSSTLRTFDPEDH